MHSLTFAGQLFLLHAVRAAHFLFGCTDPPGMACRYDNLIMQLDPGGGYSTEVAQAQSTGFKKATLKYRKIGEAGAGLECDPVFSEMMSLPIFQDACYRTCVSE